MIYVFGISLFLYIGFKKYREEKADQKFYEENGIFIGCSDSDISSLE